MCPVAARPQPNALRHCLWRSLLMSMRTARLLIVVVGVLLPYLVRLPRGWAWVDQYQPFAWQASLLVSGCNAIVWVTLLLV